MLALADKLGTAPGEVANSEKSSPSYLYLPHERVDFAIQVALKNESCFSDRWGVLMAFQILLLTGLVVVGIIALSLVAKSIGARFAKSKSS